MISKARTRTHVDIHICKVMGPYIYKFITILINVTSRIYVPCFTRLQAIGLCVKIELEAAARALIEQEDIYTKKKWLGTNSMRNTLACGVASSHQGGGSRKRTSNLPLSTTT